MRARSCRRTSGRWALILLVLLLAIPAAAGATPPHSFVVPETPDVVIVTLQDGVNVDKVIRDLGAGNDITYVYRKALNGFAGTLTADALTSLLGNPDVSRIEFDGVATTLATQSNPVWGLDRIDQRTRTLDGAYTYTTTGSGVHSYIIDTGIRATHSEFTGRLGAGYTAISDGRGTADCNGHGTHVAGTVGGTSYGVAKRTTLHAVRVLDCTGSGSWSGVIAGIDWVARNAVKPAVANMSLGGGANASVDDAVRKTVASGISVAVAAGNSGVDACNSSPARVAEAVTVGATDSRDTKPSWSNYGSCLNILAPGVSIKSAGHGGDTATATMDGTSMASPHVAGVLARYLQAYPTAPPSSAKTAIQNMATTNVVSSAGTGSPNRLLYMSDGTTAPSNYAPQATFTYSCSGLTCSFNDTSTDADGSIASRTWNFGDGTTSTATAPAKTYAAGGTFTVTLTVTDNGGLTDSETKSVAVSSTTPTGFTLSATGRKVKGENAADLTWSGASSSHVDIIRNSSTVATVSNNTTPNSGAYRDLIGRVKGTFTYKVCNAGSTTACSTTVSVSF